MALDPDRPEAYVAWTGAIDGQPVARISLVNTLTFATLGSLDVPIDSHIVGMTLGPRPPRLSGLSVVLQGSSATVTWTIAASRA